MVEKKEYVYNKNEWIRNAKKIIVSIDEADIEELDEIVLNSDHIVRICNESLTEDFLVAFNREIINDYKDFAILQSL